MIEYIILGTIQGIFEWVPISSEGVVALVSQYLLKEANPVNLALFLHLGTLFAVLIYFREEWKKIVLFQDLRLVRFLIISTIVSLAVGYPVYKMIGSEIAGTVLLAITGFGLILTAYFHKRKRFSGMGFNKLAVFAGFLQGISVIPGLSRSGATIFGLSFGEMNPSETLKLSYMMSFPVVLASSVYLFLGNPNFILDGWPAIIFSFVAGIICLHFLLDFTQRINFFKFALIFGLLCLVGSIVGLVI
jgi:undecaprenyl-diphosphatase